MGRFDAERQVASLCGVDEVGRGPLAGPVVAAAVVLSPRPRLPGVDDSKRLVAEERETLAAAIERQARAKAVEAVGPAVIDQLGIRVATLLAMFRYYDRYGFTGNARILTCLLGREPTTFSAFVARTLEQRPTAA